VGGTVVRLDVVVALVSQRPPGVALAFLDLRPAAAVSQVKPFISF